MKTTRYPCQSKHLSFAQQIDSQWVFFKTDTLTCYCRKIHCITNNISTSLTLLCCNEASQFIMTVKDNQLEQYQRPEMRLSKWN